MEDTDLNLPSYTDAELRELFSVTRAQLEHWNKLFQDQDKLNRHREGDRMAFHMLFDQCKRDFVEIEEELRNRSKKSTKKLVVKGEGLRCPPNGQVSDTTPAAIVDSGTVGGPATPTEQANNPRSSGSVECSPMESSINQ